MASACVRSVAPAKPMQIEYVSGNYFATLGLGAYAGRLLNENDDTPGAAPAIVLSYKTWQADFAADPASSVPQSMCSCTPSSLPASPRRVSLAIVSSPTRPTSGCLWQVSPCIEGANSALKGKTTSSGSIHWAECVPGINIGGLAGKALGHAAAMAGHSHPTYYRPRRSGTDSAAACHSGARRRRHPETAAANRRGPAHADDSLLASSFSSPAPTSPICCWRAAPRGARMLPCAWRSVLRAAESCARFLPRASCSASSAALQDWPSPMPDRT